MDDENKFRELIEDGANQQLILAIMMMNMARNDVRHSIDLLSEIPAESLGAADKIAINTFIPRFFAELESIFDEVKGIRQCWNSESIEQL